MSRRWLAPQVIQTSMTDCGPAVLKCLIEGHGVPVRYDRLREACATDVDGTAFDTLEELAERLGFEVDKSLTPAKDLMIPGCEMTPSILVTRQPNGFAHFMVAWNTIGPLVQLMDPGVGRRWTSREACQAEAYTTGVELEAAHWRAWIDCRPRFWQVLETRFRRLGVRDPSAMREQLEQEPDWLRVAALDAAARMVDDLVLAGDLRSGDEATATMLRIAEAAGRRDSKDERIIPLVYWSALPMYGADTERVRVQGVPVIRVESADGVRAAASAVRSGAETAAHVSVASIFGRGPSLWSLITGILGSWRQQLGVLAAAAMLAAGFDVLVAVLLRELVDSGRYLGLGYQRAAGLLQVVIAVLGVVVLDAVALRSALSLGRQLELRFRVALAQRLPRLADEYFRSRPGSDFAEKAHSTHRLRQLPELISRWLRSVSAFLATTMALIWLRPDRFGLVLVLASLTLIVPYFTSRSLIDLDMRARVYEGSLTRFYLDALLGLSPIRSHNASNAVHAEHDALVVDWVRAERTFAGFAIGTEVIEACVAMVLAISLMWPFLSAPTSLGALLLVAYFSLELPVLGRDLASLWREGVLQYNGIARSGEMLTQETGEPPPAPPAVDAPGGVAIEFSQVQVRTGRGVDILKDVTATISPGEHVAIVGSSGAGKSSLLALLLGWHRATSGEVLVDGEPLTAHAAATLRRCIAWVDPSVQLWNRSLLDNLTFGSKMPREGLGPVLGVAELRQVLERLPEGLQSGIGEAGRLLSGGEGQRVRFGRAALRTGVRLALLDEPFRGLDRERRRHLTEEARQIWQNSTMFYVSHDLSETLRFDRVLVVEGGTIVESGIPEVLAAGDTRYAQLLASEAALREELWEHPDWQHLTLGPKTA